MDKTKRKYEYLLFGIFFTGLVFGILIILGTINSGYHLVDDHEFYRYRELILQYGLWDAIKINMKGDLLIRYRPLYMFLRTITVAIFDANMVAFSICKAGEIIIALEVMYIFARKEINIFFSAVFAIMVMWGGQSEVWWRLGPQESLGMMLFAFCLLFTYNLKVKDTWYNKLLFICFIALLSFQKESFWVSVPWFLLLLFAYECEGENTVGFLALFKKFIRKHIVECLAVLAVFFFGMYMILFVVGTDKVSYAGYSSDLSWKFYVLQIIHNIIGECFPYMLALVIVILISYIGYKKCFINKSFLLQICSCAYLFLAELVIYAKSGMEDRYLLPWAVSILYMIFILGYRFWEEIPRIKVTIGGLAVLFIMIAGKDIVYEGVKFTQKGKDLHACVEYIMDHSINTDKIVAISRDGEIDYSFGVLMKYQYQYMDFNDIEIYEENLPLLEEADILFGKSGQVSYRLSEEAGISIDNYDFCRTNNYEVAIKK